MIAKWAQEDEETLDNLLNNNNKIKDVMGCVCSTYYIPVYMLRFYHDGNDLRASNRPSAYIYYLVKNSDPRVNSEQINVSMKT